jgi:hypothetical protein
MTTISPPSGKTQTSWIVTLTLVACGAALCWWVLAQCALDYTLLPWYGWTQGRVVTAEVTSEMRSTGSGTERPVFIPAIVCAYDVDGVTHRLRISDPLEGYATTGSAGIIISRLPIATRVPVFYDRQSPDTAKAVRAVSLTYLEIPALLTIMTAWLFLREKKRDRPKTGFKALAGYIVSVPGLLAYAYFSAFWVLDGKTVFHVTRSRWSNVPDLIFVWLLFTLGFCLIVWGIADRKSKMSALLAESQDGATPTV